MRSLFAKILLWFLATAVITILAFVATGALGSSSEGPRQPPLGLLITLGMREARHAYETRGPEGLELALKRFEAVVQADCYFTDGSGRDLVTGADRSDLVRGAIERPHIPLFRRNGAAFARESRDGRYWFFVIAARRNWLYWFFHPQNLWIVGVATLLCYALAYHLTSPVRRLRTALDHFGRGDLTARAESGRRDELGQLARSFNQMAERIQTLLTAERRLLMDISHELRSPLARLNVAIELARAGSNREAALNRIQKESDRLNTLVGELLEVTRAEGDPAHQRREAVRLDELVAEVAADGAIEGRARGCSVKFEPPAEPVVVDGDAELLRRAIENVLRNGIRYAPPETTVLVTLQKEPERVLIRVRDYGPGVPDDALPHIFRPFYRVGADRTRSSGGVGLGLAIAQRAVALHHGDIRALNADPGLLVEIELPSRASEPSPAIVTSEPVA